ncbi:sigma-70 family RNA polymerase sigma factor [Micromonospora costi]|uniref:Sigma-70 family RNA polymerase sigma factor n=1 Tax=Micromonospora costi TaxID=1530042 RepID=A0A3B0AES3_9ACTN|nr:sigma-70 family RNA polymerase sigma factor [Micromonospora costi]RKN59045.1 sigma-70 family RNA polymerase sigma factor [Micromonospora costi]
MRATGRGGADTELVTAARDGDPRALDALVAASLPLVYNVAGRALQGHADVDDVVQETLLRVVRHLSDLRDPAAYRSWLIAITVRQVRDREHHRRTARDRTADLDVAYGVADPAGDFAGLTILRLGLTDQRREVAEATRWLDEDDRTLLALWWLEATGELDRAELAAALGLTEAHAAVRIQRMKEQVQVSRAVVRALRSDCPGLRDLTRAWDGRPGPLWRKRLARHVRECVVCRHHGGGLLPLDRLLAGLPLLPVPPGVGERLAAGVPPARDGAPGDAHAVRPGGPRRLIAKGVLGPVAAAAAVAVLVVGGFVVTRQTGASPAPAAAPVVEAPPGTTPPGPTPAITSPSATPPAATATTRPTPKPTTARPVAPAPASTSKRKGVGVWTFDGVSEALASSTASWYYTWNVGHPGVTSPKGAEFVPMIWGAKSVTADNLRQARANGRYLLGFNEPDMGGQANMTVEQALDLWPRLEATGLPLGSPAVAWGGDRPGEWLDRFMSGAKARGHRVDFIALHWYGGDFSTTNAVNQLRSYLQAVHDRYHLPIWLTEFALIDFSNGVRFPSQAQQAAFLTAATRMLGGLSWLHRYAWFGLPATDKDQTGLFRTGSQPTAVGRAFQAAR